MRVVIGPTFSVGVVLFTAVAVDAARRFGRFAEYDPYVFEWHRRTKPDRPSGTASAIAERMLPHLEHKRRARLAEGQGAPDPETLEVVALRAGASPGMHVVGFDAPGESIELRVTARDRSAYVAGALLAADTLLAQPDRFPGVTTFEQLLTDLTHRHHRRRSISMTDQTTDTTTRPTLTLRGAFTALVTPFTPDGALDETAFVRLVERQLDLGIDGLVPVGTTGESPTTTHDEDDRIIALTVDAVARRGLTGRVPVIAGTGSNNTATVVEATQRAKTFGADAALVVAPYYNKPDQRMLEAHYRTVADEGGLPVVVYNVPGRTSCNVDATTLLRLAEHPGIIAVKEASANLEQIMTILRDRPAGFSVLSGRRFLDVHVAGPRW